MLKKMKWLKFSSVQLLSRVLLFATPWTAACQASQSITISRSSLKLTSSESVMPSTHLILCRPLFLLPPIPPGIRVFSGAIILPTLYGGFQVGLKWWISPKCVLWWYLGNYWVIPRFIIFYYSDNKLMNDVMQTQIAELNSPVSGKKVVQIGRLDLHFSFLWLECYRKSK